MLFLSFIQHIYTKKCSEIRIYHAGNVVSDAKLSSAMSVNKVKTMTLLQGQMLHIL